MYFHLKFALDVKTVDTTIHQDVMKMFTAYLMSVFLEAVGSLLKEIPSGSGEPKKETDIRFYCS